MQIPERIKRYPLISAAVAVVLVIALLIGVANVIAMLADTFGADRVATWIEGYLEMLPKGSEQ